MKHNKIRDIVMLVLLVLITPVLFAATDARKDKKPSSDDAYVIKNGDTLWDISAAYLKNPFLWPEIWKENKYVVNPDLIYPGNRLNIPGMLKTEDTTMREEVKGIPSSLISPGNKVEEPVVTEDKVEERMPLESKGPEMNMEEERVLPDRVTEPKTEPNVGDLEAIKKELRLQVPPEMFKKRDELILIDYIGDNSIDGGSIIGSKDNRELLGERDRVFIKAPKGEAPIIGDSYAVVRRVKKVIHPKTGKPIGDLIRNLGVIKVIEVKDDLITADIVRSIDYITKGDQIIPRAQAPEIPGDKAQERLRLWGYIVETNEGKVANAQFDIVYIDMGRMEGVLPGDKFLIYREGKKTKVFSNDEEGLSAEVLIGSLKILTSQENTSTALVVTSSDTIEKGSIVEKVVK
ncbi:MAG: LysM peptidoglycan-binding domain-containing protein [Nitrospirae bacterium]|nr:LysM peptidoglycan-binding domain-containing protein [Nitrospirota bacterium]